MKNLLLATLLFASLGSAAAQDKRVEFSAVQLSDSVYMLEGSGGNVAISTGSDGLFIIDDKVKAVTGPLLRAIRKISNRPIRFVINTHYHGDHVGGNQVIAKTGALIIAHDNVYKRLSTEQVNHLFRSTTPPYPKDALPVITFNDHLSLHFNGETVTAYHVAHGHTDGDNIVVFPLSNVIHMGDMYFNGRYPIVDLDGGGSIQGMVHAADLALSMADDATRIIPGHGPLAMTEDLRSYREFLIEAVANVQTLMDAGLDLTQVIAAKPTAEWDDALGKTSITPPQFVAFIYYSLKGIHRYTVPVMPADQTAPE